MLSDEFFDIWTSKSAPKHRSFVEFDLQMCLVPQWRAIFGHLGFKKWSEHAVFCTFWRTNVLHATGVPFFQIGTSKIGPAMRCFVHFGLQMCFAPQRRAIFQIGTSRIGPTMSFAHFDLQMCFAPQRRAIFPDLNFQNGSAPEVLRILTYKCASRHSGVQFFKSPL